MRNPFSCPARRACGVPRRLGERSRRRAWTSAFSRGWTKTTFTRNEPELFGTGPDPSAPNRITRSAVWEHVRNGDFSGPSQALPHRPTLVRAASKVRGPSAGQPDLAARLAAAVRDRRDGERVGSGERRAGAATSASAAATARVFPSSTLSANPEPVRAARAHRALRRPPWQPSRAARASGSSPPPQARGSGRGARASRRATRAPPGELGQPCRTRAPCGSSGSAKVTTPQPSTPVGIDSAVDLGRCRDLGEQLALARMLGEPIALARPAARTAQGQEAGVLSRAVVLERGRLRAPSRAPTRRPARPRGDSGRRRSGRAGRGETRTRSRSPRSRGRVAPVRAAVPGSASRTSERTPRATGPRLEHRPTRPA